MMNPTTSTTFVAYRDPRYVQGKALLKAKDAEEVARHSGSCTMNT